VATGALILAAGSGVAYDCYRAVDHERRLYEVGVNGMRAEADIQYYTQESRRFLIYALGTSDRSLQLAYLDQSRATGETIQRLSRSLQDLTREPKIQRSLQAFQVVWAKNEDVRARIAGRILSGQSRENLSSDLSDELFTFEQVASVLKLAQGEIARTAAEFSVQIRRAFYRIAVELLVLTVGLLVFLTLLTASLERRKTVAQLQLVNRELEKARAAAETANRMKSEFLASMSHEIRTPMSGVVGMTTLLLDTNLTAEQRDCARAIEQSAGALLTVINDILDFSKIEAGKVELDPADFDLWEAVEGVIDLLALQAGRKGIALHVRIDPRVPRNVVADCVRLRQILINLVSNAVKFTIEGSVTVRVTPAASPHPGDGRQWLVFQVQDTGVGISKEKQAELFQPFVQADASTARRFGGSGLGLFISRKLALLMDGQLSVESEHGKGSTFKLVVPFERSPNKAERDRRLEHRRLLALRLSQDDWQTLTHYALVWDVDWKRSEAIAEAAASGTHFDLILAVPSALAPEAARVLAAHGLRIVMLCPIADLARVRKDYAGIATCFTLPLRPLALLETLVEALQPPPVPHPDTAPPPPVPAAVPMRVLVAEDNLVNQKVIRRLLEKRNCEVKVANHGREAVEAVLEAPLDAPFNLVLMDCQMPEMDGFEACRAIRALDENVRKTPVVALTANAMKGDNDRCLAAGMDDYLSKPLDLAELDRVLRRYQTATPGPDEDNAKD
jgi:signal transduction histidine kinase/CheY-like chemotaxis protein